MGNSESGPSDPEPSESETPTQTPTPTRTPSSTQSFSSTRSSFPTYSPPATGTPVPVTICGDPSNTASTWKTHLTAGHFPYSHSMDCTTTITAPYRLVVLYQETFRSVETCCDYIKFYDGVNIYTEELKLSSTGNLTTYGRYLTIHFTSDLTVSYKGIMADISFVGGPSISYSASPSTTLTNSAFASRSFSDSSSSSVTYSGSGSESASFSPSPATVSDSGSASMSASPMTGSDSGSASSSPSPMTGSDTPTHSPTSSGSSSHSMSDSPSMTASHLSASSSTTETFTFTPKQSRTEVSSLSSSWSETSKHTQSVSESATSTVSKCGSTSASNRPTHTAYKSDSSSACSSVTPSSSRSSAPSATMSSSPSISSSVTRTNSPSNSETMSSTHSRSVSQTRSSRPSRSWSPSAVPTERPRGPPPPLPDLTNLSVSQLSGIFQDISYYSPLLIKGSLNSLGTAALEKSEGSFSISTPAFDLSMKALPSNVSAMLQLPNASLTMPPLSSLGSNLAASMIQWTDNPYSMKSSVKTETPMLSITVLDKRGQEVEVHNASTPIQFHWPLDLQTPPSYMANCKTNVLYVKDGLDYQRAQSPIVYAAGAWLVPCLGLSMPLNCTPGDSIKTLDCPSPILTPECIYWDTANSTWSTEGCTGSILNGSLYCSCTHLSDFSSRINSVVQSNQAVFANAANVYSVSGLAKYAQWYGIFGGIGLATLLLGILAMRMDTVTTRKYVTGLCQDPVISPLFNSAPNSAIYIFDPKSTKRCVKEPNISANKAPLSLCQRIFQQHSRLQFLFRYDPRLSRLFRLLSLFTIQFHTLFISALLYGFTYGKSGSSIEMQWYDILVLSLITSLANIPVIRIILDSMNYVGMKEYKYKFPLLCEEYSRRSEFEVLALEYLERKKGEGSSKHLQIDATNLAVAESSVEMDTADAEESIMDLLLLYFCCKDKAEEEEDPYKKLSSKHLLIKMIKILRRKYEGVEVFDSSWEILPCHTTVGTLYVFCCMGWFVWCLNYLLLFAASHEPSVGQHIMISYASSELSTIFITQPLTILLTYLFFKGVHDYEAYLPACIRKRLIVNKKHNIPHLYFFSNPWMETAKSVFTSKFAYSLFVRCPALASNTNELAYAPIKAIVYDHDVEIEGHDVERLYAQIKMIGTQMNMLTLRTT